MTISSLWKKFRSPKYRHAFVEAQLKRGVPTQVRAIRLKRGWTQKQLAKKSGLEQGSISRIENPDYGQLSFETVLAVARGFDCAFVGRFVPFSQLRALVEDASEEGDLAPSFEEEDAELRAHTTPLEDETATGSASAPAPKGTGGDSGTLHTVGSPLKILPDLTRLLRRHLSYEPRVDA